MPSAHSLRAEIELLGERADRPLRRLAVERDAAGERAARVEAPEQEVRVGDRRLLAAAAVARRAGVGARAARAGAQRAAGVAPGDRAAARADGVDVDHRQRERPAADLAPGGLAHDAVLDDADVARRAAHVEADEVRMAAVARDERGRGGAAGRPRQDRERGMAGGELGGGEAAAGLHDARLGQARLVRAREQPAQVAREQRRQRRVDLGRRGALVLAKRADDVVRQADVDVGQPRRERVADRLLVAGVRVGVQQHDGDRLGVELRDLLGERGGVLERAQHAVGARALGRGDAHRRRDERRRPRRAQPVEVGARLAAELDDVGEAVGRDEHRARAAALEQRVRRDRHAVREQLDVGRPGVRAAQRLGDRRHDALGLVGRASSATSPSRAARRRRAPRR